jgi:hypothetical protein
MCKVPLESVLNSFESKMGKGMLHNVIQKIMNGVL